VFEGGRPLAGIFIGGQARRMGGLPKGLIAHPSGVGTLVEHLVDVGRRAGCDVVLVGEHPAYGHLGLEMLPDGQAGAGPMGGLESLLGAAQGRDAFAIACDMPYVRVELLHALRALLRDDVDAVMPVRSGGREPLCALYRSSTVLPEVRRLLAMRRLALRALAAGIRVVELGLTAEQQRWLDDWDEPQQVSGC
jgi:molybdopterin-guanine dinucleotide biosynthesis protein A